jgi:hypothetical protein
MIAQCANRECTARLQFLHEGRLFITYPSENAIASESAIRYVWLCASCCQHMIVDHAGNLVALKNVPEDYSRSR